jgi:DNA processing protein
VESVKRREEDAEELRRKGIRFVTMEDRTYPKRLREIPDPPFGLYYKGNLPSDERPSVAVIGAREATRYGLQQARIFAGTLAAAGVQIVSGLAVGVDGAAEEEALYTGGTSFGILGSGVDVCYPTQNRRIYERMCAGEHGSGVLSEFHPGEQPKRNNFPARNRLISGLADLLLVCEAREKSGTQITADHALDQGKDIYAIPGRNTDALSRGCNRLIRQGAGLASCPQDLLDWFLGNRDRTGPQARPGGMEPGEEEDRCGLRLTDRAQQALFESLDPVDMQEMDVLREKMETQLGRGVSAREAGAVMSKLILLGFAQEPYSGYYCRAIEKGKGKM